MKILITGTAGFLGQRLARALLTTNHKLDFKELILVDIVMPISPNDDKRVKCQKVDLSREGAVEALLKSKFDIVFHLAAVVSVQAEEDFDLGMRANLDVTRDILEAIRKYSPYTKIVFSSSCGVFGGEVPAVVTDLTAVTPIISYGTQKAICDLLINDYTRRGFADGRILRLPTITVRPGKPNTAVTSFASGIIREPLKGERAVCPVSTDQQIWICSPDTVIKNFIHAATLPGSAFGFSRIVHIPGITVSVKQMIEALADIAGPETVGLIYYTNDEVINRIVAKLPIRVDLKRALELGFHVDLNIKDIIKSFIEHDL